MLNVYIPCVMAPGIRLHDFYQDNSQNDDTQSNNKKSVKLGIMTLSTMAELCLLSINYADCH